MHVVWGKMLKPEIDKNCVLGTLVCSRNLFQMKPSLLLPMWQSLVNLFQTYLSLTLPSSSVPSFLLPMRVLLSIL